MSLVSLVRGRRGENGFGYASTAEEVTDGVDLSGKSVLITGVNSGLGSESARVLALRGARILGAARTRAKAESALGAISGTDHVPLECELAQPESVRACVRAVRDAGIRPDVLLCNAGIMALPQRELVYGHERQFFTNHIGHFILVTELLDQLADDGRVVVVSSAAHRRAPEGGIRFDDLSFERDYDGWMAYGQSKLANLLFARELAERLRGSGKTANSLHPGVIWTNLGRHMGLAVKILGPIASAIALKSTPQGAATQVYLAAHPDAADVSGEYFADCNPARPTRYGRDAKLAERLWQESERIVREL